MDEKTPKPTPEKIARIDSLYFAACCRVADIAASFDMDESTVMAIVNREGDYNRWPMYGDYVNHHSAAIDRRVTESLPNPPDCRRTPKPTKLHSVESSAVSSTVAGSGQVVGKNTWSPQNRAGKKYGDGIDGGIPIGLACFMNGAGAAFWPHERSAQQRVYRP